MPGSQVLNFLVQRSHILGGAVLMAAMTSRLLAGFGVPQMIHFMHFALAFGFSLVLLPFIRRRFSQHLCLGLLGLFWVISASALVNTAGVLNIFLDFLMLGEPFFLLFLMTNSSMSQADIKWFRSCLLILIALHVVLSYYQFFAHADFAGIRADEVKGLFLEQGAGHHVAGAVGLTAALYIFARSDIHGTIGRALFAVVCAGVGGISDSKQVFGAFLISLGILVVTKMKDMKQFVRYAVLALCIIPVTFVIAQTLLPGLLMATDANRVQDGMRVKLGVFPIILAHYDSPLNWMVGLGPGHSVGRLAKILPDYIEQLEPLGATRSPATQATEVWQEMNPISQVYTGDAYGSSMWSPYFFWAGLWGDLGLLGLGIYLFLWGFVYLRLCTSDLSRFFVLNMFVLGGVYGWLEEPGYVLFAVTLIGLNWQEDQLKSSSLPSPYEKAHKKFNQPCSIL